MPWSRTNIPAVAKNWSIGQQNRCIAAANAVLDETGDERKAIFACIHAAGKSKKVKQKFIFMKQDPEENYDLIANDAMQYFQRLILLYFAGKILLDELDTQFRVGLKDVFVRYMLLGLEGRTPTDKDLQLLEKLLQTRYQYLDGFIADLKDGNLSQQMAVWRAGLYGFARASYIGFTIPIDLAALMPVLPSDDCKGGSLCGCFLTVEEDDENYYVIWNLDPAKEHCDICFEHATVDSPFTFAKADLHG